MPNPTQGGVSLKKWAKVWYKLPLGEYARHEINHNLEQIVIHSTCYFLSRGNTWAPVNCFFCQRVRFFTLFLFTERHEPREQRNLKNGTYCNVCHCNWFHPWAWWVLPLPLVSQFPGYILFLHSSDHLLYCWVSFDFVHFDGSLFLLIWRKDPSLLFLNSLTHHFMYKRFVT